MPLLHTSGTESVYAVQDGQRELAKTIRVSGSILLSTVSNFLDFFKMEAGKQLDVVRTEVELRVTLNSHHFSVPPHHCIHLPALVVES